MTSPQRAVTVDIKIGADSQKDLIDSLFCIAHQMEREGIPHPGSVSGGYSAGWTIKSEIDESITHDLYFERVSAYLKELSESEAK